MNSAGKFLHHLLVDDPDHWHPLLAVFYLTYACDFRCPYCSDGAQRPYYTLPARVMPADQVLALLKVIRRHSAYLVLTGGEPLQHPQCASVLEVLPEAGFRDVILTTNGYRLREFLPLVARCVRHLTFSLDTLDHEKADRWFGVGPGTLERILENIDAAAERNERRYEIVISSVVTPENIKDLYQVYDYSRRRGFLFAACPQLVGVKAHSNLAGNPAYRGFYDFLIAEKKRGGRVYGTARSLCAMRDLGKFGCRPFTMLVVSPTGDVFYPCLEIGHFAGNLLENPDLHAIRRAGRDAFGPQPACDTRCHSACALGFSLALSEPMSLAHEVWCAARGWTGRLIGSTDG